MMVRCIMEIAAPSFLPFAISKERKIFKKLKKCYEKMFERRSQAHWMEKLKPLLQRKNAVEKLQRGFQDRINSTVNELNGRR